MSDTALSPDEHQQLIGLLRKVQPGFYSHDLFVEFARLTTHATIELIPLRQNNGVVEVLLTPRDDTDPFWPGQTHIPGSIVRSTDSELDVLARIKTKELGGTPLGEPVEFLTEVRRAKRGNELAKVYWVEVLGDSADGVFYDVDQLPDNIIPMHREYAVAAAAAYTQHEKPNK